MQKKITPAAVEMARHGLSMMRRKSQVKRDLVDAFGLSARSCERCLAAARAEIVAAAGKPIEEHRLDALSFYNAVLADPTVEIRDKLLAAEGKVKLLGLAKPERIEVSGPAGAPVRIESRPNWAKLSVEELQALRAAVLKARAKA